ncbi:MAG: hypothetical protein KIT35_14710 [Piscinibacter sp.]|uniref:adenylate/guanylate cyclase domain-containing protein n=1 Tax=Piscinibacter TaxID=1114981 RepID=UPI000FDD9C0E|nr:MULTISPECIES: adenylate/guanylate cyclase domain-containing protein [Piscinibacter]MCW5665078.1 hypothetical protein [Piscinibacter sp.]
MHPAGAREEGAPGIHRLRRAVVVVDLVDSVRLIDGDEAGVIDRWRRFVNEVRTEVLTGDGARMVKSLGDGMLLEFRHAPPAVAAALDMQRRIGRYNEGRGSDAQMWLRIGAHTCEVVADELDIYGSGVNLAARLSRIAGPGEIVISPDLRDELIPGIDVHTEDLGECEVRGLHGTVRAHRVVPVDGLPAVHWPDSLVDARASIAVLPLRMLAAGDEAQAVAELIVDDIIQGLSVTPHWRVVSRLSTVVFRGRDVTLAELHERVGATYVLSGSAVVNGGRVTLRVELADAQHADVVWADSLGFEFAALLLPDHVATRPVIDGVASAIFRYEMRRSRSQPLPTLRSYTVLFAAVGLMHRLSLHDFERAWELLEQLAERHPHAPEPLAWMAKWHVMKVAQGWSHEPLAQAGKASTMTERALERQSDHALALAIDGLSAAFLRGDLDTAERRYGAAIEANPNEALAWLFLSALHVYRDRGAQAAEAAGRALSLSPLDPMRYFFDSFAATAMLAAGRYDEAIALGRRSIRANCTHLPTYRSLAIAQALSGDEAGARESVRGLLRVDPAYSIAVFRERYAGRASAHVQRYADALRSAGLPEG